MVINYEDLVNEYSEEGFESLKKYLADYVSCFCINYDVIDRTMLVEKLCDYVMSFESRNNKKDSLIPGIYVNELLPIINKTVEEPKKGAESCPAFKYVERARQIAERIKKNNSENLIEDMEDFTKILLCLYSPYMKTKKKVEDIEFKMHGIGFDFIRSSLIKEKGFKFIKPKKNETERIYNKWKTNERNNIYSVRNFAVMILSLFYIRLTDLEGK